MIKKSKKSKTPKKQKSRAQFKCPDELGEVIKFANYLPDNAEEILEELGELRNNLLRKENFDDEKDGHDFFAVASNLLDGNLVGYIYHETWSWNLRKAFKRFRELIAAKIALLAITKANRSADYLHKGRKEMFPHYSPEDLARYKADDIAALAETNLSNIHLHESFFDVISRFKDSYLNDPHAALTVFAKWYIDPNALYDRIRACEICNNIFWAVREDSFTCSKRCSSNRRTRLSRSLTDEEKAEIKAQKEKNKEYKRKLKERKNSNGTV